MKHAKHEAFYEHLSLKGVQVRALSSRVSIDPAVYDIAEAFSVLSPARLAPSAPIPLSEIESYIRLFDVHDVPRFVRLVRALDSAFLGVKHDHSDK